jgi:HK97 family phage major capsid protein
MSAVEVVSEPLTYRADRSDVSFFQDLIAFQRGERGDTARRLERHAREHELETRIHPDRTAGAGGSFAPPLWLIGQTANVPQPGRVLADLIPHFPLPEGVSSVNVPVLTTGMTMAPVADDLAVSDVDVTDTASSSPVVTISGYDDVSQQLLDQSPQGAHLDQILFKSLTESYNATLEGQLINGSGAAGQFTGLLNLAGTNRVTYTSGAPSATQMYTYAGQMAAAIGIYRKQPAEVWLMGTPRAAWITTSEDQQSRPLMLAGDDGPGSFQLAQYSVKLDDAVPRNLGTGSNQDAMILCKPSDMLLLESDPHLRVMTDILADSESAGAGTLSVRIQLHRYAAAIIGRYPTGIAVMQGTGMVTQPGF